MTTGISRLRALRLVPRAFAAAVTVEVGLRRAPLPKLASRLGVPLGLHPWPAAVPSKSQSGPAKADVRLAVVVAAFVLRHWPAGDTCLRRSLVTGHLLRAWRPQLRVGVGPGEHGPVAHAWVELPDRRCIAGPSQGMRPLLDHRSSPTT